MAGSLSVIQSVIHSFNQNHHKEEGIAKTEQNETIKNEIDAFHSFENDFY